jgi:hypothetical protein
MTLLTRVWEDCKTKEQKEQFKREIAETEKNGKYRPFKELVLSEFMRRLS